MADLNAKLAALESAIRLTDEAQLERYPPKPWKEASDELLEIHRALNLPDLRASLQKAIFYLDCESTERGETIYAAKTTLQDFMERVFGNANGR